MESPVFYIDEKGEHRFRINPDSQTVIDSAVQKHHIKSYPVEHAAFLESLEGGDPESISESKPKKVSKPKKESK